MEFVRNLLRLRSAFLCGSRILSSSIAADDLYFRVGKEPSSERFLLAIWKQFDRATLLKIHEDRPVGLAFFPGSGKGNGVAAIPSPKNRTRKFLYIRLKPFSPPVSPDVVSQHVNPGCELADGRWDEAKSGFLLDLILLWIARAHDDCASP